jgi:hypothetical protein
MKYNTEKITELAQSVANLVEESLKAKAENGQNRIVEIEREFREVLRQVGVKAPGFYLNGYRKRQRVKSGVAAEASYTISVCAKPI